MDCYASPPRPLSRHLQAMQTPQPVRAIRTHHVPPTRQVHLDAPISVSRVRGLSSRITDTTGASRFTSRDSYCSVDLATDISAHLRRIERPQP